MYDIPATQPVAPKNPCANKVSGLGASLVDPQVSTGNHLSLVPSFNLLQQCPFCHAVEQLMVQNQ